MDDLVELEDDNNYCTSLLILPTELLVMILSYLSIRDIIKMQFVSQRFKEISETPSLWKKIVWPDCEPRHMCSVRKVLKTHGIHVRQISFPVHVIVSNLLVMMHHCPKVTHLSLPRYTKFSLNHLEKIVHTMTHLEQLDMFTSSIEYSLSYWEGSRYFKKLLEVTTASIKILTLKFDWDEGESWFDYCTLIVDVWYALEKSLRNNYPLPPTINLLISNQLFSIYGMFESFPVSSYTITSLEIGLYEITSVPMDLYPSIPLRKFQFGPAAKRPLIKLSDHGILGLNRDIFYLSDYHHYGKARLSVSPRYYDLDLVKDEDLQYISNFNSVSNVDFSYVNIYPDHLEQLAIACPNLERLNLKKAQNSLQSFQGLRAIVHTCQNLQGLNLEEIPVSSMESCLLLWELLSSIKKLTHLGIDICMLIHNNCYNAADKDKLICMLGNCDSLKALEVTKIFDCDYEVCLNTNDLLLGHFPSLVYVRIFLAETECTKYAITNCHQLKYLYCDVNFYRAQVCALDLSSSSSCHLQQIFVRLYIDLSASSAQAMSAHGELEQVILFVRSITTSAITTLISNSPNLMLLYIVSTEPLCDENGASVNQKDYKDTVSKRFPHHKLLTTGDLILTEHCARDCWCTDYWITSIPFHYTTNCNSFWKLNAMYVVMYV